MPLPFQRRSSALTPTFSRDFAGLKTLDHGAGPAITFTRGSDATFFDANGVLQTAGNNVPRFDHDPATGVSRGLLIEEARTNSIRNSQAGGSTNGVIGSGGVMPTNWSITANANGVTSEVVGTGTESGLSYIDIKVSGTPSASANVGVFPESVAVVVASNGQTWTSSSYFKLVGGATTNATIQQEITGRNSGGNTVSGQVASATATPTSAAITTQRVSATRTMSSADVVTAAITTRILYTSGNPIDLTLRIAAPQLEQGAFPTSYIPTTNAAATRSADSAVVTPISSFYNQAEGTLFAEGSANTLVTLPALISMDDTTGDERIQLRRNQGSSQGFLTVNDGGVSQVGILDGSWTTTAQTVRLAACYRINDFATSFNGGSVATDASGTVPTVTRMDIGGGINSGRLNAHIRRIAYWPRRLSNTLLQQITT